MDRAFAKKILLEIGDECGYTVHDGGSEIQIYFDRSTALLLRSKIPLIKLPRMQDGYRSIIGKVTTGGRRSIHYVASQMFWHFHKR